MKALSLNVTFLFSEEKHIDKISEVKMRWTIADIDKYLSMYLSLQKKQYKIYNRFGFLLVKVAFMVIQKQLFLYVYDLKSSDFVKIPIRQQTVKHIVIEYCDNNYIFFWSFFDLEQT